MQKYYFYYILPFLRVQNLPNYILKFKLKEVQKEVPGDSLFSSSHWQNVSRSVNPRYTLCWCPVIQPSGEVPFAIFEWLLFELPVVFHRVSSSVFQRSPIIIVVGLKITIFGLTRPSISGQGASNERADWYGVLNIFSYL